MTRKVIVIAVVVLLAVLPGFIGCGKKGEAGSESAAGRVDDQTDGRDESVQADPSRAIIMNGRSVMGGWMEHWGFAWEGPVEKNGYVLDYKELDAEDMAGSFAGNTAGLSPGSMTFFKFCFVDFDGSNLSQRKGEVEEVIQTAADRQLRLIIGNVLPVRESDGNPEMLKEYDEFNSFLKQKDQESGDVWVYDFYGILAGEDGWLKPEYQTEDSHPNDQAYAELDPSFFELLDTVHGGQEP
jgi:hypothetical protein